MLVGDSLDVELRAVFVEELGALGVRDESVVGSGGKWPVVSPAFMTTGGRAAQVCPSKRREDTSVFFETAMLVLQYDQLGQIITVSASSLDLKRW